MPSNAVARLALLEVCRDSNVGVSWDLEVDGIAVSHLTTGDGDGSSAILECQRLDTRSVDASHASLAAGREGNSGSRDWEITTAECIAELDSESVGTN